MKQIILMAGLLAMGSMYVAADEQSEVDKQREAEKRIKLAPLRVQAAKAVARDIIMGEIDEDTYEVSGFKIADLPQEFKYDIDQAKLLVVDDIAQKIRKNEFNEDEFNKILPDFKPAIAKAYYFFNEKFKALPKETQDYFLNTGEPEVHRYLNEENLDALPDWLRSYFKGVSVQDLIDYNRVPVFHNHTFKRSLVLALMYQNLTSLDGLQNIPGIETVEILWLGDNQLTTLPVGIFNGLKALKELWLGKNQLITLQPGVFNGLTALQWLNLSDNQLRTLPADVFNGLTALELLSLDNNQLTTLQPGVFNDLTALEMLWLNKNQLTTLPENTFNGLTALQRLHLSDNQLTTLPEDVFNGLTALQVLWLNGHRLSDDQVKTISKALEKRNVTLLVGNQQRPPVEDESALAGSSTGSEMADDLPQGQKRDREDDSSSSPKRQR